MEHTGVYHLPLAEYLAQRDYPVGVINPYLMKKFIETKMSRIKLVLSEVEGTAKVDSTPIAEYGKQFFEGKLDTCQENCVCP